MVLKLERISYATTFELFDPFCLSTRGSDISKRSGVVRSLSSAAMYSEGQYISEILYAASTELSSTSSETSIATTSSGTSIATNSSSSVTSVTGIRMATILASRQQCSDEQEQYSGLIQQYCGQGACLLQGRKGGGRQREEIVADGNTNF